MEGHHLILDLELLQISPFKWELAMIGRIIPNGNLFYKNPNCLPRVSIRDKTGDLSRETNFHCK